MRHDRNNFNKKKGRRRNCILHKRKSRFSNHRKKPWKFNISMDVYKHKYF